MSMIKQLIILIIIFVFSLKVYSNCTAHCNTCVNKTICTDCSQAYYMNNNLCITCPYIDDCEYCQYSPQICTDCCQLSWSSDPKTIYIIAGIFGALFLLCIIISIRRCFCKQPQRPPSLHIVHADLTTISRIQLLNQRSIQWKKYDGQQIKFADNCCICQTRPGNAITSCGHLFHLLCMSEWLKRRHTCPLCRCKVAYEVTVICMKCHQNCFKKELKIVVTLPRKDIYLCSDCH